MRTYPGAELRTSSGPGIARRFMEEILFEHVVDR